MENETLTEQPRVEIKKDFDEFNGTEIKLYDPDGIFVGNIYRELQLLDVLVQIKENNLSGYFLMINDEKKIEISNTGKAKGHITSLYDSLLKKLIF